MREILFRGKRKDNGLWILGDCRHWPSGAIGIHSDELHQMLEIIPETLGQYTGLTDKNGKKIFEGDIVKMSNGKVGAVTYVNCCAGFGIAGIGDGCSLCVSDESERLIIGNIHDNPELLKVQHD